MKRGTGKLSGVILSFKPIEGVGGEANKDSILKILSKYGVVFDEVAAQASVEIWGTGKPMREFLWSEEMADACVFVMENVNFNELVDSSSTNEIRNTHINIGTGEEISIKDLGYLIKKYHRFLKESLFFNSEKPDGTLIKLTNPSKLNNLGWKHQIDIKAGVQKMYDWYRNASE